MALGEAAALEQLCLGESPSLGGWAGARLMAKEIHWVVVCAGEGRGPVQPIATGTGTTSLGYSIFPFYLTLS